MNEAMRPRDSFGIPLGEITIPPHFSARSSAEILAGPDPGWPRAKAPLAAPRRGGLVGHLRTPSLPGPRDLRPEPDHLGLPPVERGGVAPHGPAGRSPRSPAPRLGQRLATGTGTGHICDQAAPPFRSTAWSSGRMRRLLLQLWEVDRCRYDSGIGKLSLPKSSAEGSARCDSPRSLRAGSMSGAATSSVNTPLNPGHHLLMCRAEASQIRTAPRSGLGPVDSSSAGYHHPDETAGTTPEAGPHAGGRGG
jgi:hypothetical protein